VELLPVQLVPVVKARRRLRGVRVVVRNHRLVLLLSSFIQVYAHRIRPLIWESRALPHPGDDPDPREHLSQIVLARARGVETFNKDSIRRVLQPIQQPPSLRRALALFQFLRFPSPASLTALPPRKIRIITLRAPPIRVRVEAFPSPPSASPASIALALVPSPEPIAIPSFASSSFVLIARASFVPSLAVAAVRSESRAVAAVPSSSVVSIARRRAFARVASIAIVVVASRHRRAFARSRVRASRRRVVASSRRRVVASSRDRCGPCF